MDEELQNQPAAVKFYSLLIDECTDIGTDHKFIVYVRYEANGLIIELPGGTANVLLATLIKIVEENGLR